MNNRMRALMLALLIGAVTVGGVFATGQTDSMAGSQQIELEFYLLGPEPSEMSSVADAINELATKDLATTVEWTFLGWDNWSTKYNLALSSGETVDLIYTAGWAEYSNYARQGAFLPLNDLVPTHAPLSWSRMSEAQWNATKVGGQIYTVPSDWIEYDTDGVMYREDMRKRLGVAPITDFTSLEAFLRASLEADPATVPFALNDLGADGMRNAFLGEMIKLQAKFFQVAGNDEPTAVSLYDNQLFVDYMTMMRRWNQSGYIPRNILSAQADPLALFNEGRAYAITSNPEKTKAAYTNISANHPDWELGFLANADVRGIVHPTPSIRNGVALPKASRYPERALAFMEKLRYDEAYYRLTTYGVEGRHYEIRNGQYRALGTAEEVGFAYHSMQPWGWHVDSMELPISNVWPGMTPFLERMADISIPNNFDAFAWDNSSVSDIDAALQQIFNQYVLPLATGVVDDVDGAIRSIRERLTAAGYYDRYIPAAQGQLTAYWTEMGF